MPRYTGRSVPRVNDHKALTGHGRYSDDLQVPGLLHAAIVRSTIPHGVVTGFDATELAAGAGLFDLARLDSRVVGDLPVLWRLGDQTIMHTKVLDTTVRYVGQPLGVVVAGSRYEAEDAADSVLVDYDELPAVADIDGALAPGCPVLYPDLGTNVLATFEAGDTVEHTTAVFSGADRVASTTIRIGRVHGLPLEPRGIVAVPEGDRLVVHTSTQAPHAVRDALSEVLGLAQSRIRVIAPDVGGGFGLKDHLYEDEVMVCAAALELGRPVKWIEDRFEALIATTHARDEVHDVQVAFDDDGRLRGLRVESRRNVGGRFAVFGGGPLFTALGVLPGPYRWDAVRGVGRLVATNTMSTGAYRGFGQTQAAMIRERAVELVANELGRDPIEIRLANLIQPDELPYTIRTFIQYDNGDYPRCVRRAADLIAAAPTAPDDGRRRGVGYCTYVQLAGIGPSNLNEFIGLSIGGFESANVRIEPDGSVRVASGISPHGQGLETTMAQLVADELGVDMATVELIHGDTETTPYSGYGTAASRSIAVGGGAAIEASRRLAAKVKAVAAEMLEASPADVELVDGRARVVGTDVGVTIRDVAKRSWQGFRLPEDMEPGLVASFGYDPVSATFSYATHACRVAVDPGTGQVEVEQYVVVNDCGTMVNPMIVEGQIHGGVAQGLGAALMEEVAYDEGGQPLASTMLDYHVPVSASMPDILIEHMEIPSPHTPGGMKGMGEGGTNGSYAAVINAVIDALPEVDWSTLVTPLTPGRLWAAIHRPR